MKYKLAVMLKSEAITFDTVRQPIATFISRRYQIFLAYPDDL
jgi:hypothetical protein